MRKRGSGPETRTRICDVAQALFAERGFYGASLRDIGGEVGIANASLLYHYPSKSLIYAAVMERVVESLAGVVQAVESKGGDDTKKLDALINELFDWARDHPDHIRLTIRELMDNVDRMDSVDHWFLNDFVGRMGDVLDAGRKNKAIRKGDAELTLLSILGSVAVFTLASATYCAVSGRAVESTNIIYRSQVNEQVRRAILRKKK